MATVPEGGEVRRVLGIEIRAMTILMAASLLLLGVGLAQDGAEGDVVEINMETEESSFYFDPVGVQVEPGTTIRFINESGQHTATAYCEDNDKEQRIPEGAECWDSGMLVEQGATFEVTLTEEGVYDYFCLPHEMLGMVGRIIVGSPEASPAADPANLPEAVQSALPEVEAITSAEGGKLSHE